MAISEATASLIGAFKSPIMESMKEIKNEVEFFFDNGVANYIDNLIGKIRYTKTFLHRSEDVAFYDTYFPITLTRKLKNNKQVESPSHEPFELFKLKRFISIIGNAGSGKTMFMKHCFLNAIDTHKQIPILIELRNLSREKLSLTEYIYKYIIDNKLSPNKKIVERILEKGKFLFLLDGFDEIFSTHKAQIVDDIESFSDKYNKNYFLITSRPGANVEALPRFVSYYVAPLSDEEIQRFIHVQLRDDTELELRVSTTVKQPESGDYKSYLSSPLLLSMFILTYNLYPELPKSKSKFYWNVFDTLCTKHDSYTKKGGFLHERKSGLQHEEIENVLKWLAYVSLFEGKYSFDEEYLIEKLKIIREKLKLKFDTALIIEDFVVSISIIILDGFEYKFPHKSLQEYLAASLIREQSEEAKEKIYFDRFAKIEHKITGSNHNLWSICMELDKHSFYKNFVIKHLRKFSLAMKKGGEKQLVYNFYTLIGTGEGINIKGTQIEFATFSVSAALVFSITSFFDYKISPFNFVISHINNNNSKISKLFSEFISENKNNTRKTNAAEKWVSYSEIWNWNYEEANKILSGGKTLEIVSSFVTKADEILELAENNLAEDSKVKNDLLDL